MRNILRLITYIKGGRRLFALSALFIGLQGASGSVTPLLLRNIINGLASIGHGQADQTWKVLWPLFIIAALALLSSLMNFAASISTTRLSVGIESGLKQRLFRHLADLPVDYFERNRVGDITEKALGGINDLLNWLGSASNFLFIQVITLIVSISLLISANFLVGVIAAVAVVLTTYLQYRAISSNRPLWEQSRKLVERANGTITETISNIATVRSFNQEDVQVAKLKDTMTDYAEHQVKANFQAERSFTFRGLITIAARIIGLYLVVNGVIHGHNTAGDVVLVALYQQSVFGAAIPLSFFLLQTGRTDVSAGRILEVLDEKPMVVDRPDAVELDHITDIEFDGVSFAYPDKPRLVLDNISFTLPAGQSLALVGPSGVGKSTITKLLLRFYEPTGGTIRINGRDIHDFTQESVRRHVGMVMQDVALFNDTIEANLRFARPGATEAEVKEAAASAHADVFIDQLPDKFATLVGERGVKLSGGEKQRVAVARAILRSPDLIILDEATSALDSESEQHVQQGLERLMTGRTAIIIAHRLSTVMKADQILVLQDGKVLETGTHAELTERKTGLYARLYALQRGGELAA